MFKVKKYLALFLGLIIFSFSSSWAGEGTPSSEEAKKAQLFVKGAQLWPNYCANCHNALPPSNRSPEDWDVIMMHMRARANLPPDVAEAILEFLRKR